jgi:thiamine biosynthesis lipoprotein
MSTYQPNSIISRINRNENVLVDTHFLKVLEAAQEIYLDTEGVFDPTIGVLVNAWDFGPEGKVEDLDSLKIDSLMRFVGFNRVTRINRSIFKPKATFLDFNAIAKGYAVDVIAEYLETEDIVNYLVEIGGELLAKGINIDKSDDWKVGVEMPHFDGDQSILKAIRLKDESMATSGTYRKFKTDNLGNRYAHIINAETGYPSKTNILSVSVIADKCMVADAYATAFQAMDIERIKSVLSGHPELKVFLIFENKLKELETISLNDFPDGQ